MNLRAWRTEQEMLDLGLGQRVATAIVHEEMDPETFISMRAKGFGERRDEGRQGRGLIFLTIGV